MFHDGLVIALIRLNTLTKEDIMKRFMEMFEDIMVAVTFAEAGVSVSFLQQKDNHEELGEPAWDLKA
jgi:RecG-like helicase